MDIIIKTQVDTSLALKAPLASPSFTGMVGVGAVTPTHKLHVVGNVKIETGSMIIKYPRVDTILYVSRLLYANTLASDAQAQLDIKANQATTYTKTEVDTALATKASPTNPTFAGTVDWFDLRYE